MVIDWERRSAKRFHENDPRGFVSNARKRDQRLVIVWNISLIKAAQNP